MSVNLTDRGIKLLYRQRGSRSRRVAHDDDDERVVIQGPVIESQDEPFVDEPLLDGPFEEPLDEPVEQVEQIIEPADVEEGLREGYQDRVEEDRAVVSEIFDEDESLPYYNFEEMPLRQLSSSITSITSIDVLISMFTNLFENDLIPQAVKEFESSRDSNSKMMYKLDVRIFESLLEQLVRDFRDILDINMSNNELCYQLRQIVMAKEELNQELVQTRSELQKLKCGGEWYKVQQEQSDLNRRIELNDQLNLLNTQLTTGAPAQPPNDPLSTNETVSEFCELVNPYSGILAKIEEINNRLQQEHLI